MLSIEQMLKIDPELSALSRKDLEEIQTAFYEAAQLAHDVYQAKKHGSKNPVGLLPNDVIGVSVEVWKQKQKPE